MELAKNVKNGHNTYTGQVEWMDMEATSVDIDAIDTDMHARAGDVEQNVFELSFCRPE